MIPPLSTAASRGAVQAPAARSSARPARSLTIAQLLIGVAAVMACLALLVPTLKHQLGQAQSVVCMDNLHHIYHGLHMYRGDNDGWWPERQVRTQAGLVKDSNVWILLVARDRYVGELNRFLCPGDVNAPRPRSMTQEFFRRRVSYAPSYGLNQLTWREHDAPPTAGPGVKRDPLEPMQTILLADLGPDIAESQLPGEESRRRSRLETARDAGRLVADDGFRIGVVRPPGSWLTTRHGRRINLMAMAGNVDASHRIESMSSQAPENYYDDCATGACTFCNVFRAPHYDFSSSELYWWTGAYDDHLLDDRAGTPPHQARAERGTGAPAD